MQPFGQVPVYEEDGLTLFETGAIVMHIGERCPTLLPVDPAKRARARTWMFAALNSVEQHVQNLTTIDLFFANEEWARQRRPGAEKMAVGRLDALVARPHGARLPGRGVHGRRPADGDRAATPRHTRLVPDRPVLAAYLARCEARPAFQRALAAQLAPFAKHAPPAVAA